MPIFLATDIEKSTRLWQEYPQAMPAILTQHDALLGQIVEQYGGRVIKHTGDGLFAVVTDQVGPCAALAAALEIQRALARSDWSPAAALRVRVALHIGEAEQRGEDFFGLEVSRTFRLLSAAWGGQIFLSEAVLAAIGPSVDDCLPAGAILVDHGEQLLRDLSQPQYIYELRSPDLPQPAFPGLRTLSALPNNLPIPPTPFIGRAQELNEVARRLEAPTCRLLTLTGPGGIGKTRLAIQTAAGLMDRFAQGVYFVALTPILSAEHLVPAIASALSVSFYGSTPPQVQLMNYLREKELLLVLDNFEHVVEGADLLGELLANAARLKVLVTSRERLNLREEWAIEIGGMALPPESAAVPLPASSVDDYPALQLFLQAAQRANPSFQPNLSDQVCMLRICRSLEGMPLGIELAAAWVSMISCQEIAAEIEVNLDFLSTRLRNQPSRHRSLRAAFDYSWNLLQPAEQNGLAGLSSMRGEFRRDAAAQIAGVSLPILTSLAEKSLLQRHLQRDGETTFRLHVALRPYAAEKLASQPEVQQQVARRHAEYFLGFVADLESRLISAGQVMALDQIALHTNDIRQAWQLAVQQGRSDLVGHSLTALVQFHNISSRYMEAYQALQAALDGLPRPLDERLVIRLQMHLSQLAADRGMKETALELVNQALAKAEALEMLDCQRQGLFVLGRLDWLEGRYQEAEQHYQEALQIARSQRDQQVVASLVDALGLIDWAQGRYEAAHAHLVEALEINRSTGNPLQIAGALDHMGVVLRDMGRPIEARPYLEEALETFRYLGTQSMMAFVSNHLSGVLMLLQENKEGERYLKESVQIGQKIGERRVVAYGLGDLGSLQLAQGVATSGRAYYQQSLDIFRQMEESFGMIYALSGMGECSAALGEHETAWNYFQQALRQAHSTDAEGWVTSQVLLMAGLRQQRGEVQRALEMAEVVLQNGGLMHQYQLQAQEMIQQCRTALEEQGLEPVPLRTLESIVEELLTAPL